MTSNLTISRRSALAGLGLLGVAAAVGQALPAAAADQPDYALLRERWIDLITGRRGIDPDDPDFTKRLASMDNAVAANRAKLASPVGTRSSVFTTVPFGTSPNLTTTYRQLEQMATAYVTPGSTWYGDGGLLTDIVDGLEDANRIFYNDGMTEFGNWWDWEIGASKSLANSMVLLNAALTADQLTRYAAAIDHFVPDPWSSRSGQTNQVVSTGANRVDQCQAVIVRAIALPDETRLTHARDGLSVTWEYVTSGDGFYRDGSFIQHGTIAYTGTYGGVLLRGLSLLFALLAGSSADIDSTRDVLYATVDESFAPVIYDCQMMDSVRGRAVSRYQERSHDDAYIIIESMLTLAKGVDASTAARWRALCAGWIARDTYGNIRSGASLPRLALLKDLAAVTPAAEPVGHKLFAGMDRAVHRRDGWALAISMASERITWYECGNGENNRGYFTGNGMTYLYNADNGHFDDNFWPTVDRYRLPGTTVDTTPLPDKVEGEWGAGLPAAAWVGGAVLGEDAAIGQHLLGPGGTGLTALKSWFCFGDLIVALGADIRSTSGNRVETVVENRNSPDGALLVDGRDVGSSATTPARWAHLEGVGGYVFPGGAVVDLKREDRTGAWRDVNGGGTTDTITRRYVTLWLDHGVAAGQYAYVLAPGADAAQTARLAESSPVEILSNTSVVQAARLQERGLVGANFWAAGSTAFRMADGQKVSVTVDQPCAVLLRWSNQHLEVSVSDPTQHTDVVRVTVGQAGWSVVSKDPTVQVDAPRKDCLRLTVTTEGAHGASHRAIFG
ncbi:polysaccharide lyase 8 family protein [Kribbella sp. NPDC004875]|uniref:polysaccharide lyase 8 family protein n=1 Tax=Kribbella sp. NPDC004875 TaxID=3364107 RepID=UPI003693A68F